MLPTKGYFQAIECPFYDTNCGRPYCHFRHKKRPNESGEDEKTNKKGAVPTYKPTPKSELANIHNKSHIPISYVPDLAFNSVRKEKPTYNPTPISILSSARKSDLLKTSEDQKKIKDIRENIVISDEYDPSKCDIIDNLAGDFALIDDIVNEGEKKGTEEGLKKLENDIEQQQNRLNLLKSEIIEPKFSSDEETDETKPDVVVTASSVNANKEKSTKLLTKDSTNKHRKEEKKDSSSNSKNNKHSSRKSSSKEKSKKSSRTHHRHSSKDNKKSNHNNKKSRHKSKSPSPTHSGSKEKSSSSSSSRSKEKSRKTSSSSSSSKNSKPLLLENIKIEDISSVSKDNDEIHLSEYNDLDIEDEDETLRECFKIFNEYQPETKETSNNKSANKLETINEPSSLSLTEDSSYQGKKRTAHSAATIPTSSSSSSSTSSIQKTKSIILPGQMLLNRYKIAKMNQADNEQANIMREIESITNNKKATIKRPAGNLLEAARQHKMKRMQEYKEKSTGNLIDDILNGVHKPGTSQHQQQQNQKVKFKKIAAVPNVALIEKAKERISLVKQQKHSIILQNVKTVAQTPRAGNNRIAHVPEYSLSDIPNVINADKSKLPVNVRTRFLTMIADECFKLYALKEDAHNRALNEEFSCYEKCKVLATYKNSSMLAVNRIRKEVQEREIKGLGLVLSGESTKPRGDGDFEGRNFYNNVKKWVLTVEELDIHGYPKESNDDGEKGRAIIRNNKEIDYSVNENHRKCSRCGKVYEVDDDGWPLIEEECLYHPLKKRTIQREQIYLCCKTNDETGCLTSDTHVFDGVKNHFLEGYQTTLSPESDQDPRNFQVYALDCEMCYTTKGLELTRVTIVDRDCKTVYESFVKPLNPIIDYNTRFSGITKEQMDRTSTSILQVQANILHLCNSETILVGHSLESDLKALKIIHKNIIDTSVLFPHKMGLPHKRALRVLASEYLKKIIQNSVCGHDSAEDALACMDLIKWKLKEDLKAKVKS